MDGPIVLPTGDGTGLEELVGLAEQVPIPYLKSSKSDSPAALARSWCSSSTSSTDMAGIDVVSPRASSAPKLTVPRSPACPRPSATPREARVPGLEWDETCRSHR